MLPRQDQPSRPSQRAQSQLSTVTAANNTSALRSSLPPPRMEQNHRRTLYWLAVPDSYICDEYFEFTFCFCSLCRISQLCYFHLLLFPITYISPPLSFHCFFIYRSSQIIYYDIIFTHIYSIVLLSHSNTQFPQILIRIFRQLLNRSLCHSLNSFFNGPSSACFLVFSLVNSYLFLWDRTLRPKRHRPENRRSNGTGP